MSEGDNGDRMTDGMKKAARERQQRFGEAKAAGQERFEDAKAAGQERFEDAKAAGQERLETAKAAGRERVETAKAVAGERVEVAKAAAGERIETAKVATAERVETAKAAAEELQAKVKPKLRGVIHSYAFWVSLLAGMVLVFLVADDGTARLALGVYAISLSALLGTSALYHRINWERPATRRWMRRLDHSMIFLLIAGTVTPFLVLVVDGPLADAVLIAVWLGAIGGIVVETVWTESPKWVSAIVYVTVGLLGAIALPSIVVAAGLGAGILIAVGGVFYIAGAVIYATGRPDPSPAVFGYHEIFHVLVVAAAASHFAAVALYAGAAG
jgi:hemolysin III